MPGDFFYELLGAHDQGGGGQPGFEWHRRVLRRAYPSERAVFPVYLVERMGHDEGDV